MNAIEIKEGEVYKGLDASRIITSVSTAEVYYKMNGENHCLPRTMFERQIFMGYFKLEKQ